MRGRKLVLVAMLAECRPPWHDDEGLAELKRGQDRAHSGVCHDRICCEHPLSALLRRDELSVLDMPGVDVAGTDLGEDVSPRCGLRPLVDSHDQPIERQLGPDGHEDHNTAPRYCTRLVSEMRPLRQAEIRLRARHLPGKRQLLYVGNAVDPGRAGSQQPREPNRHVARRRAGRDHHSGTLTQEHPENSQAHNARPRACSSGWRR